MLPTLRQLFFIGTVLAGALVYARGPESGGGGGVVFVNEKPQLVDFFTIPGSAEILAQKYFEKQPSRLDRNIIFNIEYKTIPDNVAFMNVLFVFKKWSDLAYDAIGMDINSSIYAPVRWNLTDQPITPAVYYRPPGLPSELQIKPAAYYLMKDEVYEVSLSRQIWNKLSLQDQTGLLIHETLRHIQIGRSYSFDDEALQKATAVMLTCKPSITLDQYLFFLLHNRRDIAEKNFDTFGILTKDCGKN